MRPLVKDWALPYAIVIFCSIQMMRIVAEKVDSEPVKFYKSQLAKLPATTFQEGLLSLCASPGIRFDVWPRWTGVSHEQFV
jgi:hypothetical protein